MNNQRVQIESPYTPRAHALPFHARSERFAVLVWHRRCGKTVMCVNDLIDKAIQNPLPMPRYAYIAPLYKQAKEIAWAYLKLYCGEMAEAIYESELKVILKGNGALIQLFGADNPDALRGVYWDGVIMDEYGDMRPRVFTDIIRPTLVDRKGWCAFIGTAKGPNHFHKLWKEASNDPRWFTSMLKASESGVIDAEELEEIQNSPAFDEDAYEQEYECSFEAAVKGAFYGKLLKKCEAAGQMGNYPYDPDRPVFTAWDIGFTDDTSIWFFQYDGKTIRVIDFFTVSGYSVNDVLDVLESKPYAYGTAYLPHDAKNKSFQTGKSTLEQIRSAGIKCHLVASLSVQDGIQAVRVTLPQVQFNTDCLKVREGLDALKLYQREWDSLNMRFRETPLHNWCSNPADAFRYLALGLNPAAAKRAARAVKSHQVQPTLPSNVYSLDKLWAERERRRDPGRI